MTRRNKSRGSPGGSPSQKHSSPKSVSTGGVMLSSFEEKDHASQDKNPVTSAPVQDVVLSSDVSPVSPVSAPVSEATRPEEVKAGPSSVKPGNSGHKHQLSGDAIIFKPARTTTAPISFLNHNSTADVADAPVIVTSDAPKRDKGKGKATQQPIGTRGANYSPTRPPVWFTSDVGPNCQTPGGHYLKISNLSGQKAHDTLEILDDNYNWSRKVIGRLFPTPNDACLHPDVYLFFDDVKDAMHAFDEAEAVDPNLSLSYVSQTEYAAAIRETDKRIAELTSYYDGQVIFVCEFQGPDHDFTADAADIETHIKDLARSQGKVLGMKQIEGEPRKLLFRVEYCKITDATSVVNNFTVERPRSAGQWFVVYTKQLPPLSVQFSVVSNDDHLENGGDGVVTPTKPHGSGVETHYTSPTGRTAWKIDDNGNSVPVPPPTQIPRCKANTQGPMIQQRTQSDPVPLNPLGYSVHDQGPRNSSWSGPAYTPPGVYGSGQMYPSVQTWPAPPNYGPRRPYHNSRGRCNFIGDGPNKIYTDRIRNGMDVRTSVMIRNIPNEMNYRMLKKKLDEHVFGRYDFSYLRIDFNNNKNVGYGFLNFLDATDILPFYDAYYAKAWLPHGRYNRRYGPRIADISYACIQGLDCLIEKMRNSSVMDENKDFRPKLWWSVESAPTLDMVGTERPFPGVNNPSKKQRSRDNATQIGLYASGSRNRRNTQGNGAHQSQYDRGTTAQIQEEAYFNNQISPMQNGYGGGDPNYVANGGPVMPPAVPQIIEGFAQYVDPFGVLKVVDPAFGPIPFYQTLPNGGINYHQVNNGYPQAPTGYMQSNNGYMYPGPQGMHQNHHGYGPGPSNYHQYNPGYGPVGQPAYNQPNHQRPGIYIPPMRRGPGNYGSLEANSPAVSPTGGVPNYQYAAGPSSNAVPRIMPADPVEPAESAEEEPKVYQTENGLIDSNGRYLTTKDTDKATQTAAPAEQS